MPITALWIAAAAIVAPATVVAAPPDLTWAQLSPPGYRAQAVLDRLGVDQLEDRDARAEAILAEVQRQWQKAPPIRRMPDGPVRMTGFPVMLSEGDKPVTQILLVPYYGACVHVPPPPANQTVFVAAPGNKGKGLNMFDVIWVSGTLRAERFDAQIAQTGYRIDADNITPYTEPLPQ